MATSAREFFLFPQLPLELRCFIWRKCLPHRVVEIDTVIGDDRHPICELFDTSYLNSLPPIITRVCRESRHVAFEGVDVQASLDDAEEDDDWDSSLLMRWFRPRTDIIHLNWVKTYWDQSTIHDIGNAIPTFLREAAKGIDASIMPSSCTVSTTLLTL